MRLEGWEERLDAVIEAARTRRYVLGEHDCCRLACAAVAALTGIDRWPEIAGRYRTKREALVLIARWGASADRAADAFFGGERVDVRRAQRGDLVMLATADGERHLGINLGTETAYMADAGLTLIRTRDGLCAWRVG